MTISPPALLAAMALLVSTGCTNFVMTGTSQETLEAVREAMTRAGATEESKTLRPDLDPVELEITFVRTPPPESGITDVRTIFVRIEPWGDEARRQRTIVADVWRWNGAPPMWGGSAKEAQLAVNRAMSDVLAAVDARPAPPP